MVQESSKFVKDKDSETKKWSKPVMEKKRRERINRSLEELKRLVLQAQNRDASRYTKLEKADILEMTVYHLRNLRHQRAVMCSTDPHMLLEYHAGYSAYIAKMAECAVGEDFCDPEVRTQIPCQIACYPQVATDVGLQSSSRTQTAVQVESSKEITAKNPTRLFPPDALELRPLSRTVVPPYVVPRYRGRPSAGSIPVHCVPALNTESSGPCMVHRDVVPHGTSSGLQLTDPLWRPW